eukprot:TRINITY_DN19515_c0_g6_i1.p1 TRINITY_DN19515_c0_g6~~TRINITY_DN19515_c0_g6_i1.p1  ORF type:complete len:924 (+),score=91.28 TRINITY_DN19515_c0_g6_i1:80-2851(+)
MDINSEQIWELRNSAISNGEESEDEAEVLSKLRVHHAHFQAAVNFSISGITEAAASRYLSPQCGTEKRTKAQEDPACVAPTCESPCRAKRTSCVISADTFSDIRLSIYKGGILRIADKPPPRSACAEIPLLFTEVRCGRDVTDGSLVIILTDPMQTGLVNHIRITQLRNHKIGAAQDTWLFRVDGTDIDAQRALAVLGRKGAIQEDFDHMYAVDKKPLWKGGNIRRVLDVGPCAQTDDRSFTAAKFVTCTAASTSEICEVRREVSMLIAAQGHPHVVRFLGIFRSVDEVENDSTDAPESNPDLTWSIVFDAGKRTLSDYVAHGRSGETLAQDVGFDIFNALQHLHALHIVYRGMDADTVVVRDGRAMLLSFSAARRSSESAELVRAADNLGYTAPEVVLSLESKCGTPMDIFGLGVLLYFTVCKKMPFTGSTKSSIYRSTVKRNVEFRESAFKNCSSACMDLIRASLQKYPNQRLTAAEALEHFWFTDCGGCSSPRQDTGAFSPRSMMSSDTCDSVSSPRQFSRALSRRSMASSEAYVGDETEVSPRRARQSRVRMPHLKCRSPSQSSHHDHDLRSPVSPSGSMTCKSMRSVNSNTFEEAVANASFMQAPSFYSASPDSPRELEFSCLSSASEVDDNREDEESNTKQLPKVASVKMTGSGAKPCLDFLSSRSPAPPTLDRRISPMIREDRAKSDSSTTEAATKTDVFSDTSDRTKDVGSPEMPSKQCQMSGSLPAKNESRCSPPCLSSDDASSCNSSFVLNSPSSMSMLSNCNDAASRSDSQRYENRCVELSRVEQEMNLVQEMRQKAIEEKEAALTSFLEGRLTDLEAKANKLRQEICAHRSANENQTAQMEVPPRLLEFAIKAENVDDDHLASDVIKEETCHISEMHTPFVPTEEKPPIRQSFFGRHFKRPDLFKRIRGSS